MSGENQSVIEKVKVVTNGSIVTPKGFQTAGLHSGVKRSRNDLGAIYSEQPAHAAAVYTLNQIQAAPIKLTKESINKEATIQTVIVNSGNANACTGNRGDQDDKTMQQVADKKFSVLEHHVSYASTGISNYLKALDKINLLI